MTKRDMERYKLQVFELGITENPKTKDGPKRRETFKLIEWYPTSGWSMNPVISKSDFNCQFNCQLIVAEVKQNIADTKTQKNLMILEYKMLSR
jgi:hypothetical protein